MPDVWWKKGQWSTSSASPSTPTLLPSCARSHRPRSSGERSRSSRGPFRTYTLPLPDAHLHRGARSAWIDARSSFRPSAPRLVPVRGQTIVSPAFSMVMPMNDVPVLEVRHLTRYFAAGDSGFLGRTKRVLKAVDDAS